MPDSNWNSATSGNFATGAAWAGGAKPGPTDNAILAASGAAFTVTSSADEIVASIQTTANATLDVTGGHFSATAGSASGVNAGVIEVGGTGWFRSGGTLHNSGTVDATSGGRVALEGVVENTGGTIDASGGSVWLKGVDVVGGTLASSTGHDLLVTKSGGELDGTGAAVTLMGRLVIADGRSEAAAGSVVNKGRIGLAHRGGGTTDLSVAAAGLTLSGGGAVVLTGASVTRIDAATNGQLTNVDNRIVGAGTIGNAGLTLTNEAAGFIASAFGELVIDTGTNTLANAGKIEGRQGGGLTITGAVDNTGSLVAIGGDLTIDGAVTGTGSAAIFGGTLTFGGAFNEDVRFNENSKYGRTGGELVLADSTHYSGTITGFSTTSTTTLDLRDITFASGTTKATYSGTASGGTLTVTDGINTATIKLTGDFTGSTWTVASDGSGGTTVVDPPAATAPNLAALTGQLAAFAPGHGTMSSLVTPITVPSAITLAGPI